MEGFITPTQRSSRIKRAMKLRGMTYYALAMKMGVQTNVVQKMVEKPSDHVKVGSLIRIAAALGVSAGFLIDRRLPEKEDDRG